MSADRYKASAGTGDPGSWNRYAYTRNDPVNRYDPLGTCDQSGDTDASVTVCGGDGDDDPAYTGIGQTGQRGPQVDQKYRVALAKIQDAIERFSNAGWSDDCVDLIRNTLGVDTYTLEALAAMAFVQDASTETMIPSGKALFPGSPALAAAEQARDDATTGIRNSTIAQVFGASPLTHAVTQFNGNVTYYSAGYFSQIGTGLAIYIMFHESLHLAGQSDLGVENAWGLPTNKGSDVITYKLMTECGK